MIVISHNSYMQGIGQCLDFSHESSDVLLMDFIGQQILGCLQNHKQIHPAYPSFRIKPSSFLKASRIIVSRGMIIHFPQQVIPFEPCKTRFQYNFGLGLSVNEDFLESKKGHNLSVHPPVFDIFFGKFILYFATKERIIREQTIHNQKRTKEDNA